MSEKRNPITHLGTQWDVFAQPPPECRAILCERHPHQHLSAVGGSVITPVIDGMSSNRYEIGCECDWDCGY